MPPRGSNGTPTTPGTPCQLSRKIVLGNCQGRLIRGATGRDADVVTQTEVTDPTNQLKVAGHSTETGSGRGSVGVVGGGVTGLAVKKNDNNSRRR